MNSFLTRGVHTALALAAVSLLAAGCASPSSSPDQNAPGGATAGSGESASVHDHSQVEPGHVDAAWLDDGNSIAVVTWGSSSCVPRVDSVAADGQTISVTLLESDSQTCTRDLGPQAALAEVPEGVDVTSDVTIKVTLGESGGETTLTALSTDRTDATGPSQNPSAGWFAPDGIVLLTYGSSTCTPIVGDVALTNEGATATFESDPDRMCTMDLVPRLTPILLPEEAEHDSFELTLSGDNLDATVRVLG